PWADVHGRAAVADERRLRRRVGDLPAAVERIRAERAAAGASAASPCAACAAAGAACAAAGTACAAAGASPAGRGASAIARGTSPHRTPTARGASPSPARAAHALDARGASAAGLTDLMQAAAGVTLARGADADVTRTAARAPAGNAERNVAAAVARPH